MSKRYKTYDGPGYRKKPSRKRTARPKKKTLIGYDVDVVYQGLSVVDHIKIRGGKIKTRLDFLKTSKKADTSVKELRINPVYK